VRRLADVDERAERRDYWATRSFAERIAEVESLRRLWPEVTGDADAPIVRVVHKRKLGEPAPSPAPATRRTIAATVHLLSTSDGGRKTPLQTGYRSLIRFEGSQADLGFELELDPKLNPSGIAPGEMGAAQLSFWALESVLAVKRGDNFEIREGTRVVGHGSVT
jgi:elongation factor Tu